MLRPDLMPTRLLEPTEQRPLVLERPSRPSRIRSFYVFFVFVRFFARTLGMFLQRSLTTKSFARALRREFEQLGGLWVKFGQLLSLRSDVFPRDFCVELARLQDQATGFPSDMARAIIKEELGLPPEDLFDEFEEAPFAAASIGQIHRAHLRSAKVWVAIKVQRPHISEGFLREMRFVRLIVAFVRRLWFVPNLHWDEMLWELNQILVEEIDFRYEAASTRRMRKNLRKHKIYVPKVFLRYSTRRVMVSEFIHAVLMADYIRMLHDDPMRVEAWCHENNVVPRRVAERLYNSMWRQMLEDNLFHGDMHPGNIILLRDSRLAMIDFGSVGSMEKEYQRKYALLIRAMAETEFAKAADLLFMLSGALPQEDLVEVKQKLIRCLRAWEMRTYSAGLPYREKSMTNVANDLIKILFQHECSADWSFLRITRAQETLDQSLLHLQPDVNYTTLTRRYFRRFEWRERRQAMKPREIGNLLRQAFDAVTLPSRLAENAMFQNWIIRRQVQVFRGSTSKVAYFFAVLCGRLSVLGMITTLFFFFAALHQHSPENVPAVVNNALGTWLDSVAELSTPVWVLVLGVIATFTWTCRSLNKQLSRKERSKE
jgi:ubiquinone biosynthesis protein